MKSFKSIAVLFCLCLCFGQIAFGSANAVMLGFDTNNIQWDLQQWQHELALIKQAGFRAVIISNTVEENAAYYPTAIPGYSSTAADPVGTVLSNADTLGLDVYLGLRKDGSWWSDFSASNLQTLASADIAVANELNAKYSSHCSLAGWFMPEKINYVAWGPYHYGEKDDLINSLLVPVTSHLKSITPEKKVVTSSFIYSLSTSDTASFNSWWSDVLPRVPLLDAVIFCDGLGTEADRNVSDIVPYYRILNNVCSQNSRLAWAGMELDLPGSGSEVRPYYQLRDQLITESQLAESLVSCDWFSITPSPNNKNAASSDFQRNYIGMSAFNKGMKKVSLNCGYEYSHSPNQSYPDVRKELTDGVCEFDMLSQVGWYSINDAEITVDLGESVLCRHGFDAAFMVREGWGVQLPTSVEVYSSDDGIDYTFVQKLSSPAVVDNTICSFVAFPDIPVSGRYFKFKIKTAGYWIMCSELGVYRAEVAGDFNADGSVDFGDLNVFADKWLADDWAVDNDSLVNYDDLGFFAQNWNWQQSERTKFSNALKFGRTVEFAGGSSWTYWQQRSARSIASEIANNGFDAVYYFVSPGSADAELIRELHDNGIAVAAMVFPTMPFNPSSPWPGLPANWSDWVVENTDGSHGYGGNYSFSYAHPDYIEWLKMTLENMLNDADFDGFTFVECFYSGLNAYSSDIKTSDYGDVSPTFQQLFKDHTGNTHFPVFDDSSDPHYYKTDTALYQDLVEFRAWTIVHFYDEIVNGSSGLREKFPDLVVSTWSMALDQPNALAKLHEHEANDAFQMIRTVKPDMHYLQTHWPDWIKTDLPSDYVKGYSQFLQECRKACPDMPMALQTEIGSVAEMRRSEQWYKEFVDNCKLYGYDSSTYYAFFIRDEVYSCAPVAKSAQGGSISKSDGVVSVNYDLSGFDARYLRLKFYLDGGQKNHFLMLSEIEVNGNTDFDYVISPLTPPYVNRADNTGRDLANNIVGSYNYDDPDWIEWAPVVNDGPAYVIIDIDLGSVKKVSSLDVYQMSSIVGGIYPYEKLEISYAAAQGQFTSAFDITDDIKTGTVEIHFDQRIEPDSVSCLVGRTVNNLTSGQSLTVQSASVDGNIAILKTDGLIAKGDRITLDVGGVTDQPSMRLPRSHIEPKPLGPVNTIPAGTIAELDVVKCAY